MVFVLAFNAFGLPFFYWVKIQLCKIKAEVAESRGAWSSESLHVFSSADKQVRLENSTELRVSGKMYDIVKTETRDGVKYYYATSDDDEDFFISKLSGAEKQSNRETAPPIKTLKLHDVINFARGNVFYDFDSYTTAAPGDVAAVNVAHFYPLHFNEIFSPPPNSSSA